jgi:hypothetical protein
MDVPAKPRVAKRCVAASMILSAAAFCSRFDGRPTLAVVFVFSDTRFPPHLPSLACLKATVGIANIKVDQLLHINWTGRSRLIYLL